MSAEFHKTSLPGVILIKPDVYHDPRGLFVETYHLRTYSESGISRSFVQDNFSHSRKNTLRGLHYQLNNPQGKIVYVISGEIYDVAVDIRRGSPTFGEWTAARLSSENRHQVFIPEGFAHGFCVLSETADVIYKCTDFYSPGDAYGIIWSDPDIAINWPVDEPFLSDKDQRNPKLSDIHQDLLPVYAS
jgi:dTDP-4-dehydrorhamnose 3,5-epimerase